MNNQSTTGKEKTFAISFTEVKRIDPSNNYNQQCNNYDDKKDNYDDEVIKGEYIDYDDSSLLSELLKDKANCSKDFRDCSGSGSISYLFDDDEYDYRKSAIEDDDDDDGEDDDDDDDDDNDDTKEDDNKNSLEKECINKNNDTTTDMYTTNDRHALDRRHNSRLSDITFDSDHDNNDLSSLNDSAFILGESLMGSRRFAPNYSNGFCTVDNSDNNYKRNATIEEENHQQQDHHQECSDTVKISLASKHFCGATSSLTTAPPNVPRRSSKSLIIDSPNKPGRCCSPSSPTPPMPKRDIISKHHYCCLDSNRSIRTTSKGNVAPPTIPQRTNSNKSSTISVDSLHSSYTRTHTTQAIYKSLPPTPMDDVNDANANAGSFRKSPKYRKKHLEA